MESMRFPANNASHTSCKTRTRFTRKRLLQELIIAFRGISAADCVVSIVTILGWVCLEACSSLAQFFNNIAEPRPWAITFPFSICLYYVFLIHYSTLFLSLTVGTQKARIFWIRDELKTKKYFAPVFAQSVRGITFADTPVLIKHRGSRLLFRMKCLNKKVCKWSSQKL